MTAENSPQETPIRRDIPVSQEIPVPLEVPIAPDVSAALASSPSLVPPRVKPKMGWGRRIEKIVLALFCLEVGGFLLIFPWVPQWGDNYFFTFAEHLRPFFMSPYFRGAVSGLGALNLYLAIVESVDFLGSFLDS